MNYSFYEHRSKSYITGLVLNANLGTIGSGIFFVALNACIWEVLLVLKSEGSFVNINSASLSGAIPFGGIFGGLCSSYLATKFGRRKSMIFADILTIIACALSLSSTFGVMIAGRTIAGYVVGINYMVIPLYVREISPPDMSGKMGSYFRIFFTIGLLLSFLVSLGLSNPPTADNYLWRVIFMLPCIFSLIRITSFLAFIKMETPKYYMEKDQEENAIAALEQIFRDDQVEQVYRNEKRFEATTIKETFGTKYRSQIILVVLLILVTELMGANALNFYTSNIFLNKTLLLPEDYSEVRILNIIFATIRLAAAVLGRFVIDKVGRRPLLVYGNLLCIILAFAIFSSDALQFLIGQQSLVILYSAVQGLTFTMVLPIYAAELLPTFGIALQVVIQMLCVLLVTLYFPFVGVEFSFLIFGIIGIVAFVPVFKLAKETRGKTMNEVYRMFQADKGTGLLDQDVESDVIHDLAY